MAPSCCHPPHAHTVAPRPRLAFADPPTGQFRPKVLVTLTSEQSKVQHSLVSTSVEGCHSFCNLTSALQIAQVWRASPSLQRGLPLGADVSNHECWASVPDIVQLILKNRQNSNQRQRIVVFVGSPLGETDAKLEAIGKMLKKNGVALDVVSFGHVEENADAVALLLASAAGLAPEEARKNLYEALLAPNCQCNVLVVPKGASLTESLMSSPILLGEDGSGSFAASGAGHMLDDDEMDPELAMALKLSMEEETSRLQKEKAAAASAKGGDAAPSNEQDGHGMALDNGEEDEDAMMARAIAMSYESAAAEGGDAKPDASTK